MSATERIMCPPINPVSSRLYALLVLFLAGLAPLAAQDTRRNPAAGDSSLVQVNIRAESQALPEALEIGGMRIPGYRPTVVHLFPATGVVLDDRGHVLAFLGYRWVDLGGSDLQVEVEAPGGRRAPARLVGIDQSLGVALVSSPDSGLRRTPLCDSCEVRDGTTILAPVDERPGLSRFGSATVVSVQTAPKGFARGEWIVTVSRPLLEAGEPLLDSNRRVIGFVATQMRSERDLVSTQAIVYPISQLLNSASKILRSGGDIRTGWLGVFLEDSAQKPGLGVAINRVEPDSPAEKAGLQPGDVVVRWDGQDVRGVRELIKSVQDSAVGSRVAVDVLRQGKPAQLFATVEARRYQKIAGRLVFEPRVGAVADPPRVPAPLGLQMMALTPQLGLFFQVPDQSGVLVVDVDPESPYARAGIMAGDVIYAVDSQRVRDPQSLAAFLRTQSGPQRLTFRTVRHGMERNTSVEIPVPPRPPRKP